MLRHLCGCLMVGLVLVTPALAEDGAGRTKSVAELIKQLDAEKSADREAASKELIAKGGEAIPALLEATQSKSAEVATRALDVLRTQLNSSDTQLKLRTVAEIKKLSLKTPPPAPPPMDLPEVVMANELLKSVNANSSSITTNFLVRLAGGVKSTGSTAGAGVLTFSFADGSRISIQGEDNQAIRVFLSERQHDDGKLITKDFLALSVSELKEKYPEGFAVYEAALELGESYAKRPTPSGPSTAYSFDPSKRPASLDSIKRLVLDQKMREQSQAITQRLNEATEKVKKAADTGKTDGLFEAIKAMEQAKKDLEQLENTIPTGR